MTTIPQDALELIGRLNDAGYPAYVVGGCVRDSLLGVTPKDWDICTGARPEEMQQVFRGFHVVETGLKHGTLTVVMHHTPYEVTTFRVDGAYTDHRHPDGVTFVTDVREDLARRDFTVNAMAYHPQQGLVDAFDGQADLQKRLIRCVGCPEARFEEDALRILRALRFAAVYDFAIEAETAAAIHALYPTLERVAAERIRVELGKLLCGRGVGRILREYHDVITFVVPELRACVGFEQHSSYHRYDVYEHIVHAVENVRPTEPLRLTMLLHDCAKPACFTMDEQGRGHTYGHQEASARMAAQAAQRLKLDNATRDDVLTLVENHDIRMDDDRVSLKRLLSRLGARTVRDLIEVHRADATAKGMGDDDRMLAWAQHLEQTLDALLAEDPCVTVKQLAVNGGDLVKLGFPKGPLMGACMNAMLTAVIDETVPNDHDALCHFAKAWLDEQAK